MSEALQPLKFDAEAILIANFLDTSKNADEIMDTVRYLSYADKEGITFTSCL